MPISLRAASRSLAAGLACAGCVLLAPTVAAAASPPAATHAVAAAGAPVAGARVNPAYPDPAVSNGRWGFIGLTGMLGLFGYRAYTARRRPDGDREERR